LSTPLVKISGRSVDVEYRMEINFGTAWESSVKR
jgi:hypothetical protein